MNSWNRNWSICVIQYNVLLHTRNLDRKAWSWIKINSTFSREPLLFQWGLLLSLYFFPWLPLLGWEVIAEGDGKEIESQGYVPSFEISPGTSGYKQGHSSPGMLIKAKNKSFREGRCWPCVRPFSIDLQANYRKRMLLPFFPLIGHSVLYGF